MMIEDKAKQLLEKFKDPQDAYQCAIILLEETQKIFHEYGIGYMGHAEARNNFSKSRICKYYTEVKDEIFNKIM